MENSEKINKNTTLDEIEQIAIEYFKDKYPMNIPFEKEEIDWIDMLSFAKYILIKS